MTGRVSRESDIPESMNYGRNSDSPSSKNSKIQRDSHLNENANQALGQAAKNLANPQLESSSSSFQTREKKKFSLKRGGSLENTIGKMKNLFSGKKTSIFPNGESFSGLNKANSNQIAEFLHRINETEASTVLDRHGEWSDLNVEAVVVDAVLKHQGDHYDVFKKLFYVARTLKESHNDGDAAKKVLEALNTEIEKIPENERSQRMTMLLRVIASGINGESINTQPHEKKLFSLKQGGSLENAFGKFKNVFKGDSIVLIDGKNDEMLRLNVAKLNSTEIAAAVKNASKPQEQSGSVTRQLFIVNRHQERVDYTQGKKVVDEVLKHQGEHYHVFKKLYNAAESLIDDNEDARAVEVLNALRDEIVRIPIERRSKQLRTLLENIQNKLAECDYRKFSVAYVKANDLILENQINSAQDGFIAILEEIVKIPVERRNEKLRTLLENIQNKLNELNGLD